jgi:hypothetical protein
MKRLRKKANLSASVNHNLNMYVLAAGAAGVSVLALSHAVEARIVYTRTNVHIGSHNLDLDLDHDGVTDFTLHNREGLCFPSDSSRLQWKVYEQPVSGLNGNVDAEFTRGQRIGKSRYFYHNRETMIYVCAGRKKGGEWTPNSVGYLALEFQIKGKLHYGWARVKLQLQNEILLATLTGYAYETIPGKSIKAGQTKEMDNDTSIESPNASLTAPTPEPATLGMLAMGAPALSIWRREESMKAMQ